jgi:indole-3-glycerol phosphate synthase
MILDDIAAHTVKRVVEAKGSLALEEIIQKALELPRGDFPFEEALKGQEISFICEIKRASPSKGIISQDFPYLEIARDYQEAGATCISCLTEPRWFLGSDNIFKQIRKEVSLPMLRKDFTVDSYQLYEAKCLGANAILLIASLLDKKTLQEYLQICDQLGLSALVEVHNEKEIDLALSVGARIIGVNNRNLNDFTVDISNAISLREKVPKSLLFVAESGIKTPAQISLLKEIGVDAVLIGEALMMADDKKAKLEELKRELR